MVSSTAQLSYVEKLKDPRWQRKRLEILSRDDFTCVKCFSKTKTLNVHHRIYLPDTDPWDYPEHLLVTVCDDCHVEERSLWALRLSELEAQARRVFWELDIWTLADAVRALATDIERLPTIRERDMEACVFAEIVRWLADFSNRHHAARLVASMSPKFQEQIGWYLKEHDGETAEDRP